VQPGCAGSAEEIGKSDLVFIALKTTANAEFSRVLPPLVGPQTAIVTLQNGLGNEEQLAKLFPARQILGGLCFVCLNRVSPGVIHHLDHGLIVLGEFQRPPEPRTHEIAGMIRHAGVPCKVSDNLARAHWEKLVWNIPFNGLGVAGVAGHEAFAVPGSRFQAPGSIGPCLTTDKLLADTRWEQLVRELMNEVIATANALGLGVAEDLGEKQIERTRTMGAYKASTLLDFEQGRPLELESLFLEPLRQARQAGVATPRLATLCELLRRLDSQRPGAVG
jgi:2-dehydropantoate 2-reductase